MYTGVVAYALKSSKRLLSSTTGGTTTTSKSSARLVGDVVPLVVGVFFAAFGLYMEIDYIFKRIGLPPGDSGYPGLGHLFEWFSNPKEFLTKKVKQYGHPFMANFLATPSIVLGICSDEDVRWINTQEREG